LVEQNAAGTPMLVYLHPAKLRRGDHSMSAMLAARVSGDTLA
jgi:hypothetical protein